MGGEKQVSAGNHKSSEHFVETLPAKLIDGLFHGVPSKLGGGLADLENTTLGESEDIVSLLRSHGFGGVGDSARIMPESLEEFQRKIQIGVGLSLSKCMQRKIFALRNELIEEGELGKLKKDLNDLD